MENKEYERGYQDGAHDANPFLSMAIGIVVGVLGLLAWQKFGAFVVALFN